MTEKQIKFINQIAVIRMSIMMQERNKQDGAEGVNVRDKIPIGLKTIDSYESYFTVDVSGYQNKYVKKNEV
jgi:hypothetical protein